MEYSHILNYLDTTITNLLLYIVLKCSIEETYLTLHKLYKIYIHQRHCFSFLLFIIIRPTLSSMCENE